MPRNTKVKKRAAAAGAHAVLSVLTETWRTAAWAHPAGPANTESANIFSTYVLPLDKLCGIIDDQLKVEEGTRSAEEADDLLRLRLSDLTDRQRDLVVQEAERLGIEIPERYKKGKLAS